jgi:alpha-L-rhamnosidase
MKTMQADRQYLRIVCAFVFLLAIVGTTPTIWGASTPPSKPIALKCDSLVEPLGIDTLEPRLSWQLQDKGWGAKQTAYEILVSKRPSASGALKADIWDSGRIASEQSVDVRYAGPALEAQKRYYWQVRVWDKDGKSYPLSDASWWETGLFASANWKAKWIGYEGQELHSIREAGAIWITNAVVPNYTTQGDTHHDFRFAFPLQKSVKRALLYATGQDTAAAWINGAQVLQAQRLTPWKQMPWKSYVTEDVTAQLHQGQNLIAIGVTHYDVGGRNAQVDTQIPMSMCLYLLMDDGSVQVLTSASPGWKAAMNASENWYAEQFDDSSWKSAEPFAPKSALMGGGDVGNPIPTGPVTILRHNFEESKPILSARLYATALGAYKFHINGKVVGDQILAPGWMDFRQHVPYQVYDVTAQLKPGKNAIATFLAPGWYSTPLMWFRQPNNYGNTPPAVKAQLRIEHSDGSVEWINTDESWKADISPILSAEIYDGETYDARRVQPGWDTALFSDAKWRAVNLVSPQEPQIVAQYFQPIREEKVLTAKAITNPSPGVYVYDFGQNLSGVPRLSVKGQRGDDIKLRFAEVLNSDGSMYVENLRTAKATDHFILAGGKDRGGVEEYQPQFTFHGFRYIEISGLEAKPDLNTVKTVVFHTDAPFTTKFESGDAMVNQLWSNIQWGQRSNFIGVPTDCPQRDERLGWAADAQVFWRTAAYNMDLNSFTQKFSADLRGTQVGTSMYGIFAPGTNSPNPGFGTGWSDAGVIIPWTGWIQTGNKRIIEENWDAMERYLSTIRDLNPDFLWRKGFGIPFGDWLTPTQTTPEDLIATAYWAYDVTLMKEMAAASGRTEKAAEYGALFDNIKAAFNKAYVHSDGFVGAVDAFPSIPPPTITPDSGDASKAKSEVETQTGYVLALYMKLLPDELRAAAAQKLIQKIKDNHWLLGTGFLGTPYLLEVLSDTGHSDIAYRLLLNKEYPSWGYLIEHGATTTWERWNGDQMRGDPSMNSYNHYAYGAVAEWIYRYAAGVDATASDSGFRTIYLHPNFDSRLGHLNFAYESAYGTVVSNWKMQGSDAVWNVTIPANSGAVLPVDASNASSFTLDELPLSKSSKVHSDAEGVYILPAGTYSFKVAIKDRVADTAINGSL